VIENFEGEEGKKKIKSWLGCIRVRRSKSVVEKLKLRFLMLRPKEEEEMRSIEMVLQKGNEILLHYNFQTFRNF